MKFSLKWSVAWALVLVAASQGFLLADEFKIKGEVLGQGAPCVQFLLESGETVSLEGVSPQHFKPGMRLELDGAWMRISTCMQGRAFRVTRKTDIQ